MDAYTIYDGAGKSLASRMTNSPIEVPPGDYRIEINGTRQPVTVFAGQEATAAAGSAVVAGAGADAYTVYDGSGKSLASRMTNSPVELFPGNYEIDVSNTRQPVTVRAGQRASATVGVLVVAGAGADAYTVYDGSGKSLASRMTNSPVELFPGNYKIDVNNTRQPVTVRAGQRASVSAGAVVVNGKDANGYTVYDGSGKSLASRTTNSPVELFPGDYSIEVNGARRPVTVHPGSKAIVK